MRENPRIFWTNVRTYRERFGVTMDVVSELLDIPIDEYSNMENRSTQSIPERTQEILSNALGKSIEELWDYYIDPLPFWDNEKKYRILNRISPEKIAKAMGCARSALYHREGRKTPIKASEATVIADVLGTTLEKLAGIDVLADELKDILKNDRSEVEAFLRLRDELPRKVYNWLLEEETVDKLIELHRRSRG